MVSHQFFALSIQVERMASEYSTKMDDLRNKAEMAEAEGIELQKTIQEL